jgi:probable HAF family extracellular repeat protein
MPVYTYTTLDDPSATNSTVPQGINASGQIVGYYNNVSGTHGFLLSGGVYTIIDDPLATNGTLAQGINASGRRSLTSRLRFRAEGLARLAAQ